MSKFNSSISVLGIAEVKVQQAILKLLENSLYQKELLGKTSDNLTEQLRRVRQQLSQIDFDIDEMTAQEIADKISVDMSACVASANASKVAAAASAASADEDATACNEDAQAVQTALENMEGTIAQYATQAATTASAAAVASATQAAQTASDAATTATQKAEAATTSAQNAATTAQQASDAATAATQAIQSITFRNLAGPTTFNSTSAQYRKIATLPAVSTQANAVITFWGAMGGWMNAVLRQIYVSIGNRQSGNTFSALDIEAYYYRASLPTAADIVIYKESNNTFSVYLKGAANAYFRHELAMSYNEQVTAVSDTFKTSVPTGTQVWSFLSNAKRIPTADEFSNYALANHNHSGVYQPVGNYAAANHNHDSAYAAVGHNHNGVYQPAGSYAAADHDHSGVYQPAGSYADENHNHSGVYQPAGSYAPETVEKIGWAHINTDLANSTFLMSGLVSESSATYNLKVTFINTTTTARSCLVSGTTVSLDGGSGQTASHQTTVSGSGSFTIDNIVSSVDVFVRIWR